MAEKFTEGLRDEIELGIGLVQETPPGKLAADAAAIHEYPGLIDTQLDVLVQEDIHNPGHTYPESLQAAKTPEEAAAIMMYHFERPGQVNGLSDREMYARAFYEYFA